MAKQDVNDLVAQLYSRCQCLIDLRYSLSRWTVMIEHGNTMIAVPGTRSIEAERALEKAITRWDARNSEHPFVLG